MSHTVYWLKYPDHDDPYSQGYIGRTRQDLKLRGQAHRASFREQYNNGAIMVPLHENLTYDQAKQLEHSYRPRGHIGWNTNAAGSGTNSSMRVGEDGKVTKHFNIRLEEDFINDMKEYALAHDITMTDLIVDAVKKVVYT